MNTNPPNFNAAALPDKYRENWGILIALRSDACVAHAKAWADAKVGKLAPDATRSGAWVAAFDHAAAEWEQANPLPDYWASGNWPTGADSHLGQSALADARHIMAKA